MKCVITEPTFMARFMKSLLTLSKMSNELRFRTCGSGIKIEATRDDNNAVGTVNLSKDGFESFDVDRDTHGNVVPIDLYFNSDSIRLLFTSPRNFSKFSKKFTMCLRHNSDFACFWIDFGGHRKYVKIRIVHPSYIIEPDETDISNYPVHLRGKGKMMMQKLFLFPKQASLVTFVVIGDDIYMETGDENAYEKCFRTHCLLSRNEVETVKRTSETMDCTFDILTLKLFMSGFDEKEDFKCFLTNSGGIVFTSEFKDNDERVLLEIRLLVARIKKQWTENSVLYGHLRKTQSKTMDISSSIATSESLTTNRAHTVTQTRQSNNNLDLSDFRLQNIDETARNMSTPNQSRVQRPATLGNISRINRPEDQSFDTVRHDRMEVTHSDGNTQDTGQDEFMDDDFGNDLEIPDNQHQATQDDDPDFEKELSRLLKGVEKSEIDRHHQYCCDFELPEGFNPEDSDDDDNFPPFIFS